MMKKLQYQIHHKTALLEQDMLQWCRQARLDLEEEVKREKKGNEGQMSEKKQQLLQLKRIDQDAHDQRSQQKKKTTGLRWFKLKPSHFWLCRKKVSTPDQPQMLTLPPLESVVGSEKESPVLESEGFRKRLSLIELDIEDDCSSKIYELRYVLWSSVPADMIHGAP